MLFTLLFDFGMFVCIWCVQLIIYPSFTFYSEKDLIKWHLSYTPKMVWIVGPLMIGQVLGHMWLLAMDLSSWNVLSSIAVTGAWLLTFGRAVPLHEQISIGENALEAANKLLKINRYRTALWSLSFAFSLIAFWMKS